MISNLLIALNVNIYALIENPPTLYFSRKLALGMEKIYKTIIYVQLQNHK